MTTLITFVLVFGAIVLFHELGHFLVAKAVGVRVYEFAIGFGPKILRFRRGETKYSIRLLPLGGFVAMAGMEEIGQGPDEGEEETDPNKLFRSKPIWARMATIAAGPAMNFILSFLLFALIFGLTGIPQTQIADVVEGGPAEAAGLQAGDQILAVDGQNMYNIGQVILSIAEAPGRDLRFRIDRDGKIVELTVRPVQSPEDNQGMIGVSLVQGSRPAGLWRTLGTAAGNVVSLTWSIIDSLGGMLTGRLEPEVAGPLGIVQIVGETAQTIYDDFFWGLMSILMLAAFLSLNLGLLNLLPIPILDGGWLVFLGVEGIRGRPVAEAQRGIFQLVGLGLLLALMVFATYKDIVRIILP